MQPGGRRDSTAVAAARRTIVGKQDALRSQLQSHGFQVTGSTNTLLNAVFVKATSKDVATLRAMPGVRYVAPLRQVHLMLDQAVQLIDAPAAWSGLGGTTNAGAGQKIAIIDTGIDQTHPAFQDATLTMPSGFPKCDTTADCAFTTNKVIVARSYVQDTAGVGIGDTSNDFPDDYSPRDRVGHGTAVAMCAGGNTNVAPLATITGLAPKAYLGNYKIYGSPGINDGASEQAIILAFEDAFTDGMDVVNFSSGSLPVSGPNDAGAACGNPPGEACDPLVQTVEQAVAENMVVVVAAGNDGADGNNFATTLNSISSPAYATDVIAVGATGNSRILLPVVNITGPNVPGNLQSLNANASNGPSTSGDLTAPLIDASSVGDLFGCHSYPAGSMAGDVALIERGTCTFTVKIQHAQNAGAVAVILFDDQGEDISFFGVDAPSTSIPSFAIDQNDGLNLKSFLDSQSGITAVMNTGISLPSGDQDQVSYFSSRGPTIGSYSIKPEVVAPGENIYTATESYDPNGELYSASRYGLYNGTSFATPITAGVAAMVRQRNPGYTATQVKSAIVNTATLATDGTDTTPVTDPYANGDVNGKVTVLSVGAGKVDALAALNATVSAVPSTVSFGALQAGYSPNTQQFVLTNLAGGSVTLNLSVSRTTPDSATQVALGSNSITLSAGQSQTVSLTLTGSVPSPGIYDGNVLITGSGVSIHVPYLYIVGDGIPASTYNIYGGFDIGFPGQLTYDQGILMKVTDQYGVPVAGAAVSWNAPDGGSLSNQDSFTDANGLAFASTTLGPNPTTYTFNFFVTGTQQNFTTTDQAFLRATINNGGVLNAASSIAGNGIAPGSYISLYGSNMTFGTQGATSAPFPISINPDPSNSYLLGTSVGFDSAGPSAPGALAFISPTQINVQVPWELAGQSSAAIKVNNEPLAGALVTVPVVTYSPAAFLSNYATSTAAAEDLSFKLISTSHPAVRGTYIQMYVNGLGPVSNQPATGAIALSSPLSNCVTKPTVTIGGQAATVQFAGLSPGSVGLYQINVQIPAGISAGTQPVVISIGGIDSPTVNVPVQ